ncbi:SIR2 family protein [Priestia aryabhattai]|uniref:SIR2 family protein n=1 Tax=Priestia aryabhattai TaxID=412384 RepID=UPI0030CD6274
MINWPNNLIKDIAKQRAVVFLGSGISRNSISADGKRPPTWEEFLRVAMNNISGDISNIEVLLKEKDYLTACEIIVDRLGEEEFNNVAVECFQRPGFKSHEIHEAVFKLDSRIVATPNVDKIYDTYANQRSRGTVTIKHHYDEDLANKLRSEDKIIIKVHGTIDKPKDMIFTRSQYSRAKYNHAAFYQILSALALTHTFIFLGCGLSDPDIKLILENYAFTFPNCRPHYFVTSNDNVNPDLSRTIKRNYNLEVITYSSDNNHKDLCLSLQNLALQVEAERDSGVLSY